MKPNDNPFSGKFDSRNFGGVMREILIFRINQFKVNNINTPKDFWRAQQEIVKLRVKLERVYKGQLQRAKSEDESIELWMIGLAAYMLICEEGKRMDDVREMSGPKLVKKAREICEPIVKESTPLLAAWQEAGRPAEEAHIWQMPYCFEKKFMPETDVSADEVS